MLMASACGTFITTGEEDVCDEDKLLLSELKRRTNHDDLIKAYRPRNMPNMFPTFPGSATKIGKDKIGWDKDADLRLPVNKVNNKTDNKVDNKAYSKINNESHPSRRQEVDARKRYGIYNKYKDKFPVLPLERTLRHKMLDLMEQAIYGAQYRLKDLEPIIRKYTDLVEYRIHYIFKRMEVIEYECELVYNYLVRDVWDFYSSDMSTFMYIMYYEDVLMKHVDVTYMSERLGYLHGTNEGKLMKDRAADKQQYRSTLPDNFTERYTGAMSLDDIVRAEMERERQDKMRHEQALQNRPAPTHTGRPFGQ